MKIAAMKFSMIVVTTSCAPVHAFSAPGMKPHPAPVRAPAPIATGTAMSGGAPATEAPTAAAPTAPMRNWPCAPMLKSPALKPSPTAKPPRMSGAAATIVKVIPRALPNAPSSRFR